MQKIVDIYVTYVASLYNFKNSSLFLFYRMSTKFKKNNPLYKDFTIGWKSVHFTVIGWVPWIKKGVDNLSSIQGKGVWLIFGLFNNSMRQLFLYYRIYFGMKAMDAIMSPLDDIIVTILDTILGMWINIYILTKGGFTVGTE